MMLNGRKILFAVLGSGLVMLPALTQKALAAPPAQPQAQQQSGSSNPDDPNYDPRNRQRSDKDRYAAQKALRQELKGTYKTWLAQEVTYIISDEERKAFMSLSNDEERDAFIENFWLRRNPNPDSPENEFREEHYRRIAYANEHYAAGKPGWKTDRGRIYISWGPPDNIESHPSGGSYERTPEEGGGSTTTFPFETWHYRYLEGVGTLDRSEKDALLHVPGAGLTQYEEMNHKDKTDRFKGNALENIGGGPMGEYQAGKVFDRIELGAKLFAPPPVKFKDLEAFVSEHKVLTGPIFPFDVRTDYVKVTESMDTMPITIQIRNRDITFVTKDGVSKGMVNILGKVTTLAHKTVQTFEDTVEVDQPSELLEKSLDKQSVYWKALPLQPGLYRLDIAIKDVNNPDHVGLFGQSIDVPTYHDEKLGTSSLILADQMNTVSSREIGNGNFILGNMYIRPRVSANRATPAKFHRSQSLNFWIQVYNLGIDEATKSNQATVTYQITDAVSGAVMLETQLDSKDLGAHSDELTLAKTLPMAGLQPGKYKVTVKINDAISKQEIAQSAPFVVE